MKFCTDHWAQLRKTIEDKGMGALVGSAEATKQRLLDEIEGDSETPHSHDPLWASHWAIMNRALEEGGMYLLYQKDDGTEHCPLCEVHLQFVKHRDGPNGRCGEPSCPTVVAPGETAWDLSWIDGCTDSQLIFCREKGLLREPQ